MKSRTVACSARCSSVKEKNTSTSPESAAQAEQPLGDDVALDLRAAAPDGLRTRPQERVLQVEQVELAVGVLVMQPGDVGEQLTDVLVGLAPLQLRHARRRAELLALLDLREHVQRVVLQALQLDDRAGDLLPKQRVAVATEPLGEI